jgi:hypothetical protein
MAQIRQRNLQILDDPKEAITLLREVIGDREDFVYKKIDVKRDGEYIKGCKYLVNDKPSCLVGHALVRLGASRDVLRKADRGDINSSAGSLCAMLGFPRAVADVFDVAQREQDSGTPWGRAVKYAEKLA